MFSLIGKEPRRLGAFDLDPPPPRVLCELIHSMLSQDPADRPYPPSVIARWLHNLRVDLVATQPGQVHATDSHGRSSLADDPKP